MKKVFFIIFLAFFSIICVNAQETDSLQIKSDTISIESLASRLDKLQHDYDYLRCEYDLKQQASEIGTSANEIQVSVNYLLNECYHKNFDIDLYVVHRDKYNELIRLFNSLKENITKTQASVSLRMISSHFTDIELILLKNLTDILNQHVVVLEGVLNQYKIVLDIYKDME